MGQIITTQNLVATKVVRQAGQQDATLAPSGVKIPVNVKMSASMGSSIIQSRSWYEDSGSNEPEQWEVSIGSGYGLVPAGTKPLPEPMLTLIHVAIWCH